MLISGFNVPLMGVNKSQQVVVGGCIVNLLDRI
jgi:hypothetical protein